MVWEQSRPEPELECQLLGFLLQPRPSSAVAWPSVEQAWLDIAGTSINEWPSASRSSTTGHTSSEFAAMMS